MKTIISDKEVSPHGVKALLGYLSDELLSSISKETAVDYQVKKLEGWLMFKLLLYTHVCSSQASLRVMEEYFSSVRFQSYTGILQGSKTRASSLSARLNHMDGAFMKGLYDKSVELFKCHSPKDSSLGACISRVDSTMVSLSGLLLSCGMVTGPKAGSASRARHLKLSMSYDGLLASRVHVFTDQQYLSEDVALKEAIFDYADCSREMITFDRGISKRLTYDQMSEQSISFVTRLTPGKRYEQKQDMPLSRANKCSDGRISIEQDLIVRLHNDNGYTKHYYRLIIARRLKDQQEFWFLTNFFALPALQIAEIYRRRWDVEVFFKFLKQHMNLSHLMARSLNGITNYLYAVLIAAMFIAVYKQLNKIASDKIAKLRFEEELFVELITHLISLCGGDPALLKSMERFPAFCK